MLALQLPVFAQTGESNASDSRRKGNIVYLFGEYGSAKDNGDVPAGSNLQIEDVSTVGAGIGYYYKSWMSWELFHKKFGEQTQKGTIRGTTFFGAPTTINVDATIDIKVTGLGARFFIFDYLSLRIGIASVDAEASGTTAYSSSGSTGSTGLTKLEVGGDGFYLGFGINIPIGKMFDLYIDQNIYAWESIFGDHSQAELAFGFRVSI